MATALPGKSQPLATTRGGISRLFDSRRLNFGSVKARDEPQWRTAASFVGHDHAQIPLITYLASMAAAP